MCFGTGRKRKAQRPRDAGAHHADVGLAPEIDELGLVSVRALDGGEPPAQFPCVVDGSYAPDVVIELRLAHAWRRGDRGGGLFEAAHRHQYAWSRPPGRHRGLEGRFVVQDHGPAPPDRRAGRDDAAIGSGVFEQRVEREEPSERMPDKHLLGGIDPVRAGEPRLQILLQEAIEVVGPAHRQAAHLRHDHPRGRPGRIVEHPARRDLPHRAGRVIQLERIAHAHDDRWPHFSRQFEHAGDLHRGAEVAVAIQQIDHRIAARRGRGQRLGHEDPVGQAAGLGGHVPLVGVEHLDWLDSRGRLRGDRPRQREGGAGGGDKVRRLHPEFPTHQNRARTVRPTVSGRTRIAPRSPSGTPETKVASTALVLPSELNRLLAKAISSTRSRFTPARRLATM